MQLLYDGRGARIKDMDIRGHKDTLAVAVGRMADILLYLFLLIE